MSEPVAPTGARLEHRDGTVTPLELVYDGVADGLHQWTATTEFALGDRLSVDVLPPLTSINLRRRIR